MKKLFLFICICCCFSINTKAQVNLEVEGDAIISEDVGIGNTNPMERLDVNGGIRLGNTINTNAGTIRYNGNFEGYDGGEWKSLTGASNWNKVGSNLFYDSGTVQVGSPSNFQDFRVDGSIIFKQDGVRSFIIPNWAPNAPTKRVISGYYDGQGVYAPVTRYYGPLFNFADIGVDTLGHFIVQTADVTRMTILQDGKVGIGNTDPMEKLDINGGIRLGNSTAANNGTIRYNGSDIEGHIGGAWTSLTSGGGGGSLWTPAGSNISYTTGNVGIGTTASNTGVINLTVSETTNLQTLICSSNSGVLEGFIDVTFNVSPAIGSVATFLVGNNPSGTLENAFLIEAVSGNGVFAHDVNVAGNLSKGGGSFKIDHPLDPENKYLYHSFVESPDMMNVYNGNTTTDENGNATVTLPDYFEALNRDFRYQLTAIGTFAQLIIKEKLDNNTFVIASSEPNVEVSWQITGIRQDAYANKNRIPNEVEKKASEKGFYLHPEAFDQPLSKKLKVELEEVKEEDLPKRDTSKGLTIQGKM